MRPVVVFESAPPPWASEASAVAAGLATDLERGLSPAEAEARLAVYGRNELDQRDGTTITRLIARQFTNTMTLVLTVAGVVTVFVGDLKDTAAIALIVLLNAIVGFVQEHRAEQAMAALRRISTPTASVVRDGAVHEVLTTGLVPGDVVRLAAGDMVPADLRLTAVHGLRVSEATLTGEPEPVPKFDWPLPAETVAVADRRNMAFSGTAVTYGRAQGIVIATGMDTELGQIAALLQAHGAASTPLQRRLAALGRQLAIAAAVVCAVVFFTGIARGEPADDMFLTAVTLAVAAVPEGLPAIVTVALAVGARRMADRHAVVRRLLAVETLGSVSVICTDKTGTLTENRMVVERVWTPTGDPTGLAAVAAACNDAIVRPGDAEGEWIVIGDPMEGALLVLAGKLGVDRTDLLHRRPRVAEIAFDARRMYMTTVHRCHDKGWVAVKGALDVLAPLVRDDEREIVAAAHTAAGEMADEGYRVLALAERWIDAVPDEVTAVERDLHFLGLVGLADPPRREAADAIATCRAAGITPVMITGDHPSTAAAIARRLGLADGEETGLLTGEQLRAMSDAELVERVPAVGIYARTSPEQKLRIVEAWKATGATVAMTGDGVNDAPALRRADIGVAMGLAGTDVSREAADMVLTDDNFATIVHAVEEGRRIYDNLRRFVRYLLGSNAGEIWVMFLAPLFGLPMPLLPLQILWINLVTDGMPAVALGLEPAEPGVMRRRPRPADQSILGDGLWQHVMWVGLLMAAVNLPLLVLARAADWPWQTMVFTTLALMQLGNAVASRSEQRSSLRLGLWSNPWLTMSIVISAAAQLATVYVGPLRSVFETDPLDALQLAIVLVLSSTVFVGAELDKWRRRRRDIRL